MSDEETAEPVLVDCRWCNELTPDLAMHSLTCKSKPRRLHDSELRPHIDRRQR